MSKILQKKFEKLRIGTRASLLAVTQASEIKSQIVASSDLAASDIEIVKIKTSGDKFKNVSLADLGGKGLFIKELEEALVTNKIDIAVHSAKDVPPEVRHNTKIAAFSKRKDSNDYFISKKYNNIDDLPSGALVGTSSARRKSIILGVRPDLDVVNFRGNVDTRLEKISNDEVDATILALCGLQRLGKEIVEGNIIPTSKMLPSVGQGSLALQIRSGEQEIFELLQVINDQPSQIALHCERMFLYHLNASCKSPISVFCEFIKGKFSFKAKIYDFDGKDEFYIHDLVILPNNTSFSDSKQVVEDLALQMAQKVQKDAAGLLQKICG